MNSSEIKEKLFRHCLEYVESHIETNRKAYQQSQDAAFNETKTVASEEPETGKERMQREMETFGQRLEEAIEQKIILQSIQYKKTFVHVEPGALVETSMGAFFIALGADEIDIDGIEYCPVSLVSPIGQAIKNSKAGESVSFRDKTISIERVC